MVDSTDLNKTRKQTGQAFSILGQATGAEYKRRRKEEEDYQRRMMRDKFKYGLISAAISPAVQAFGKSASDFAGDIMFGKEEDFFRDTEDGRKAAWRAKLNKKRLEELEATRAEILKKGRAKGSTELYGVDTILEERRKAIESVHGGNDESQFINDYIYSAEERTSAEAEWQKQWDELNNGIRTLKAAPSLAEMEAAYNKTAIGQSRGRQAVGRALAWLRGKDYDKDIRKPAIKRILTAGVPGQSQEWYDMSSADLEENYLTASNVVEGLDAYTENLLKNNPELGRNLKAANDARKQNSILVNAISQQDTQPFIDRGYTKAQANEALVMGATNKQAPTKQQADRAVTSRINSSITGIIPNSGKTKIQENAATFFSFEENSVKIKEIKEALFRNIYATANEGKLPKETYEEVQGNALGKPSSRFSEYITSVDNRFQNLSVQLVTEAERLVRSDMLDNQDFYFSDIAGEGARRVEQKTYEYMHLLLESNLGTETVKTVPNPTRFPKVFGEELIVPEEILNGTVRRASFTTQESIKEELNNKDDLMDIGVLSSLPIFQEDDKNPEANPLPSNAPVIDQDKIDSLAIAVVNKNLPPQQDRPQLRASLEQTPGMLEAIKKTEGGQEFLNSLYPLTDKQKRMNALGSREDRMNALGSREDRMNALGSREKRMTALGSREDRIDALGSREERMESLLGEIRGPEEVVEPTDRDKRMAEFGSRKERMDALGRGFVARTDALGSREERMGSLLSKPEDAENPESMSILERLGFDPTPLPFKSEFLFDKNKAKKEEEQKVVEAVEKADEKIEALVQEEAPQSKKVNKIVASIKKIRSLNVLTAEQVYTLLGPRSMPYSKKVNGQMTEFYYEREGFSEEIKKAVMKKLYGA